MPADTSLFDPAPDLFAMNAAPGRTRLWALIPCAGVGTRLDASSPKQYQQLAGQALVLHTLEAFAGVTRVERGLVVVASGDDFFSVRGTPDRRWSAIARGGATRAQSVSNGLAALQELGAAGDDWVLVHDAARCLITAELVNRLIDACLDHPVGGLLAQPVADTLKLAGRDHVVTTLDRSQTWLAQTPQMFRIGMLRSALMAASERVTDESSAIEAMGLIPKLVRGSALNFKVTYAEDFELAGALLRMRRQAVEQDANHGPD